MEGDDDTTGFDINAAVDEIGEGLGFSSDSPSDDPDDLTPPAKLDATVTPPAGAAAPTPAATPPATDPASTPPTDPTAAPDPLAKAPISWRPEAAAEWATLSPTIKAEIAKREEDIFKGIEGYKVDASLGKDVRGAIGKYIPMLQQLNMDPVQTIGGLMDAHYVLSAGTPEQKAALFTKIAADYGMNLAELAVAQPPYRDPEVERLTKEVEGLKSTASANEARQAKEARAAFEKEVNTFAADPKNTHFATLANDIAALLQSGVASSLRDAYDRALWQNPITRQAELTRQQAESEAKAKADATAKAEAARKAAGANVRASAKAGSTAAPLGSIDDTLNDTYKAIMARG